MNRIHLFFLSLILLTACRDTPKPKGVLDEQKMVKVMTDLHIIDGYMASLMYSDSLRIAGKNYYATVYKNHKISKATYDSSLKYYSTQPVLLDSMYSKVTRTLDAKEKRLNKLREQELKKQTKTK